MRKLLNMTDFVLHESFGVGNEIINKVIFYNKCSNYAQFLKQSLKLEMFVVCDNEGVVLEEPNVDLIEQSDFYVEYYNQQKEKVLFEGCYLSLEDDSLYKNDSHFIDLVALTAFTIDEISTWDEELTLTETAIKQIVL